MALPPPPPSAGHPAAGAPAAGARPGRRAVVAPGEVRPARWWYWIAGALVLGGTVLGLLLGARAVVGLFRLQELEEFVSGESFDVALDPDEPKSVYVHQPDENTPPAVACSGDAPPGAAIELIRTELETAVFHGTELWVEEYEVEVSSAGGYTIECRALDTLGELRLGLGPRSDPLGSLNRFSLAGLLGTAATGAGVVLGLVVGLKRSRHRRRLLAERSLPAPGHLPASPGRPPGWPAHRPG